MPVSIHTHLHSAIIDLPQLSPLVGKNVRIIVVEEPEPRPARDMGALDRIAGVTDLDFDAIEDLRRRSIM